MSSLNFNGCGATETVKKAKLVMQLVWGLPETISLTVSMSETMGAIKDQVCDKFATDVGQTFAAEPELFQMELFPESWSQGLLLDDDPTKTLEQVLNHTRVRDDDDWEYEFDDKESSKVIILPLKFWFVGRGDEDEDEDYKGPAFTLKRPDNNTLLDDTHSFRISGTILASRTTDQGEVKRRCIPHDGLTYPLELIHNLETTASHVLLTFNPDNFNAVKRYVIRNERLVCLQVNWDKFSYLFLRKLRHHLGPQVYILAITNLDLHHLDLLAFLDTPPCYLPKYYGWDLSKEYARLGVQDSIDVDIKWLGIRTTDFARDSLYRSHFRFYPSSKDDDDSADICHSLLNHPHITSSKKTPWLVELRTIYDRKWYRSLPLNSLRRNNSFRNDLCKFYLPEKIKTCNWC